MATESRALPLPQVSAVWDRADSSYPERIRVAMSDGQVLTYRLDVEQPHPCFVKSMEILQKMPYEDGYQPKHQQSEDEIKGRWKRFLRAAQRKDGGTNSV